MDTPMVAFLLVASQGSMLLNDLSTAAMIIGGILAVFSIPAALAVWLFWSRMRPRAIAVSFQDQQSFLYRLAEGVHKFRFRRATTADGRVLFEPTGLQKFVGMMSIAVVLPDAGTAQITGPACLMRVVKHWYPDAAYQKYAGPTPYRQWFRGWLKVFGVGLASVVLLIGGAVAYEYSTQSASARPSAQTLPGSYDLEQRLELTAYDASHGVSTSVVVGSTGKTLRIKVPRGVETGTRLRFRGQGLPGQTGAANGDLYLTISVK